MKQNKQEVLNIKWMVVIFVLSASFVVYKIYVMDEIDLDMLVILFISFLSFLFGGKHK